MTLIPAQTVVAEVSLKTLLTQLENKVKVAEHSVNKTRSEKISVEEMLRRSRAQTAQVEAKLEESSKKLQELELKNKELTTIFDREYNQLKRAFDAHQETTQQETNARRAELGQLFNRQESVLARSLSDSRLELQAALAKLTEAHREIEEVKRAAVLENQQLIAQAQASREETERYWKSYQSQRDSFKLAWKRLQERLQGCQSQLTRSLAKSEELGKELTAFAAKGEQQKAHFQLKFQAISMVLEQTREAMNEALAAKNAAIEKQGQLQQSLELERKIRGELNNQEIGLREMVQAKDVELVKLKSDHVQLKQEYTDTLKRLNKLELTASESQLLKHRLNQTQTDVLQRDESLNTAQSELSAAQRELRSARQELTSAQEKLKSLESPAPLQFDRSIFPADAGTIVAFQRTPVPPPFSPPVAPQPLITAGEIKELLLGRITELSALELELKRLPPNHHDRKQAKRAVELLKSQITHLRKLFPDVSVSEVSAPRSEQRPKLD